jgi:hypothetical protein
VRDFLADDAVLMALLLGGIYSVEQTGRSGISRSSTPDAYDAAGFLQACAVLKAGETRQASPIRDSENGAAQALEIYLYDDGDSGYGAILTARDRILALLDRQWIDEAGYIRWLGGAEDLRDPKLNNAALARVDFELRS